MLPIGVHDKKKLYYILFQSIRCINVYMIIHQNEKGNKT